MTKMGSGLSLRRRRNHNVIRFPGVLRVDMREYTEFDESLDQRYWSDETDWESRLPDESESESVSAE